MKEYGDIWGTVGSAFQDMWKAHLACGEDMYAKLNGRIVLIINKEEE